MAKPWEAPVDETGKKVIKGILTGAIVLFLLLAAFSVFYTIESGQEGVVLTFGRANPVPSVPGLHFKVPFVQQVIKFDMRTQKFGASAVGSSTSALESASSADLQIVSVQLAVNYKIAAGKSAELFSTVGAGYEDTVIAPAVHEATKAVMAKFNAQDLITNREQVRAGIEDLLREKLQSFDINVQSVSIINFDFSPQFNAAIESKVTAEQLKLKADNDLQRIKVEAAQVAATAAGQRDAQIAVAEGQAKATQLNAQAEADKVRLVQEQLKQSPQYVNWVLAQKWSGNYPSFYMTGGSQPNLLLSVPNGVVTATTS